MEKIQSFQVDHDTIGIGMYISRIDGDICTYDIRMCIPNSGKYLDYKAIHTIEHLFATYARNTKFSKNIVYVGPMGCRTGFYFLTRGLSHKNALQIVQDAFSFILNFNGDIPGCSRKECGNYLAHDLTEAKQSIQPILSVLQNWTEEKLQYN